MRYLPFAVLCLGVYSIVATHVPVGIARDKPVEKQPSKSAVSRARKQVKMLDHIYKSTVVLITEKYVNKETDFAAGSAAVALFKSVTDAGYHSVRLLDVTGNPYEEKNVAKNAFEKRGVKALQSGKAYFEEVTILKGKPYLRAMTPVPVVSKKCIMCHSHYAKAKKGAAVGAISYAIPID